MRISLTSLTPAGGAVVLAALTLSAVGVLCIHAAPPDNPPDADLRQAAFVAAGVVLGALLLRVGYQALGPAAYACFGVGLILLLLLLIASKVGSLPMIRAINKSYRWISLPGFKLQPSEVMKVGYIVALAWYLRRRDNVRRLGGLLGPFVLTVLPMLLVLLQPDLGTALLMMPVLFVMLFAAGARLRHLLTVILLGLMCLPVFWMGMKDYQQLRIAGVLLQIDAVRESISNDENSPWKWLCSSHNANRWDVEDGYQLISSKTALGSGGLFGQGWKQGTFVEFEFLPARHNDFIFAIIGEQFGFAGCLAVLSCYLIIIVAGLEIAVATSEPFGKLLAVGVVAMIFTQTAINVGMTVGLTPVTGITLPFVSYGGSSILVNYLLIGLLVSVSQHRPFSVAPRPFESAAVHFGAG